VVYSHELCRLSQWITYHQNVKLILPIVNPSLDYKNILILCLTKIACFTIVSMSL